MTSLKSRFPIYSRCLRLYPAEYRKRYEQELLQTTADMLDDAPSRITRIGIWSRVLVDLPLNVLKQQVSYAGGVMHDEMPHFVKRNGLIAGIMLLPFFTALCANGLDKVLNNHTLFNSWLWHTPVLGIWVIYLPTLALLLAGTTYLIYIFKNPTKQPLIKRILDIAHSWPILLTGLVALGILFILVFHDSFQCWAQSPTYLASHLNKAWQCSQSNKAPLIKIFERAFRL